MHTSVHTTNVFVSAQVVTQNRVPLDTLVDGRAERLVALCASVPTLQAVCVLFAVHTSDVCQTNPCQGRAVVEAQFLLFRLVGARNTDWVFAKCGHAARAECH